MAVPIDSLKRFDLFSDLDASELQLLAEYMNPISLKKGEILFRKDDPSTHVYVLCSGLLVVTSNSDKKRKLIISYIRPGESLGQVGVLANQNRTLTVHASLDSELYALDQHHFKQLCHANNKLLYKVTTLIAALAHVDIATVEKPSNTHYRFIALVPLSNTIDMDVLNEYLEKYNKPHYKINLLSQKTLNQSHDAHALLHKSILQGHRAVFTTSDLNTQQGVSYQHLQFADRILLIIDENTKEEQLNSVLIKHLREHCGDIIKELVILHNQEAPYYKNTQPWLQKDLYKHIHHVCLDAQKSVERLLRIICGKAIGVVLSGGALKSWANVGALQALHDKNIPIDYLGGTSSGAATATLFAMSHSIEEFLAGCDYVLQKQKVLFKYTWPLVSICDGKVITKIAKRIGNDINFEQLAIPSFCISTNLSTNQVCVWKRGPIWKALRATMAIPTIFPPMHHHGELHVDGAVANNYPADIMKKQLDNAGFLIGIFISPNAHMLHEKKYNFPLSVSFWQGLKRALVIKEKHEQWPRIRDIFISSMYFDSQKAQQDNEPFVDLHIIPNLREFSSRKGDHHKKMIQAGYDETMRMLNETNFEDKI